MPRWRRRAGRDLDDSAVPLFESLNADVLARVGPERGERLVRAVDAFVGTHPGLGRVLATPGIKTRFGFKKAFEQIIAHVRVQQHL